MSLPTMDEGPLFHHCRIQLIDVPLNFHVEALTKTKPEEVLSNGNVRFLQLWVCFTLLKSNEDTT